MGFSYDAYIKTSANEHKDFVKDFHRKLYESPFVYEKEVPQVYCESCKTFLADRFVLGKCPKCGSDTRGDQCDSCGSVLEPETLIEPKCAVCGKIIGFKKSTHLYIAISKLQSELEALVESHPEWRKNAIAFTKRYINEGLRDRALTRDLEWGISVPKEGYENKTIYIWAENVLGYLSASRVAVGENANAFSKLWGEDAKHYYVHGKDNIPFHTIILPALLLGNGEAWHLPDQIVSSEYLTLEGRKISTSQNYAIWVKDLLDNYEADSIRYFFIANGPEKKDAINEIFDFIRNANKFFDTEQPWITRNTNKNACDNTLYQCVQIIANLAVLLSPFLPFSSEKVLKWLNLSNKWKRQHVESGYLLPEVEILFHRIDKKVIEEETEKLKTIL